MSKRLLQAVVLLFGLLPIVTGVLAVTGGPAGMLDGQATTSTVDSEVRFMGVYWAAYGGLLLFLVPRIAVATATFRVALGVMFASGAARLLSAVQVGRPHPVIFGAMLVELVLPAVLWAWQSAVASAAASASAAPRAGLEPADAASNHGVRAEGQRHPAHR